jgi:hypothetical protein
MSDSTRLVAEVARELSYAKQDAFDKTMQVIRDIADAKIRDAARCGKTSVQFEVPRSMFGRPPYELALMGRRLAEQLYSDGYKVVGTHSNMNVTWRRSSQPSSARHQQQQSSVIQVPVPKKTK